MPHSPVLVIAEMREGAPTALALELLGLARDLAREHVVAGMLFGKSAAGAKALIAHGADCVYVCEASDHEYDPEVWLPNVAALARELSPHAILVGHTPAGADLAPRLAFRLEVAVATGCVAVSLESGKPLFTRPAFGGNVREAISFAAAPAIATVRAGVGVARSEAQREGRVIRLEPKSAEKRMRVVARGRSAPGETRLEDAKIIIAGGRGLEGPEGFRVLEELARVLGAAVGSSRVPCDLGWCPHSWQIGLTGKTVTPDLYFAVGISGAGHHMAGCGSSRTIVAINTDPDAAIFKEAKFGIVGDYRKVVPALVDALKNETPRTE